jgi:peptidoglycan pentaglycine glycine transferase (the first glycine)
MAASTTSEAPGLGPVQPRASGRFGAFLGSLADEVRARRTVDVDIDAETTTSVDRAAWDEAVTTAGGSPVQSWLWGELFEHNNFEIERVRVENGTGVAQAQVVYHRAGPFITARVPRGPVITADDATLAGRLILELDRRAGARGAVSLTLEPARPLPFAGRFSDYGFVRGPARWYPARTVRVPLVDDEALFRNMRSETRYEARVGVRRGLQIGPVPPSPENMATFYHLLEETSDRNAFFIEQESYYRDFMATFGLNARLFFAVNDGDLAAAAILVMSGREGIYMFGASSTRHRVPGAAAGIQVSMMREARDRGCVVYDLWGIPEHDPAPTTDGHVRAAHGNDWSGLFRFKTGFGGEIVSYPRTVERRYHRLASVMARRMF